MDSLSEVEASNSVDEAPLPPLKNPKYRHISRSAAKRESVQLLGSIKDLQLHFSRVGVEHRAGSGAGVRLSSLSAVGEEGDEENRPPSAASSAISNSGAARRERRPWKDVELPRVDPVEAKREIQDGIGAVREAWGLGTGGGGGGIPRSPTTPQLPSSNTRELLIITASSIRRVRALALGLSHTMNRKVSPSTLPRVSKGRTSISTPSRPGGVQSLPRGVSYGSSSSIERASVTPAQGAIAAQDSLSELRKSALEVLAGLRALEERSRINRSPLQSRFLSTSIPDTNRALSPSSESTDSRPRSSMSGSGEATLVEHLEPISDDEEEYNLNALAAAEGEMNKHLQTWEERIVNEAREYRALEIAQGEGAKEREYVRRWCGVVDRCFLYEARAEAADKWAEGHWEGRPLERVHEFLWAHLPLNLKLLLPSTNASDFRSGLLTRLTDGLLLAQAFNAAVAASTKVWGLIPPEDVHDTISGTFGTVSPDKEDKSREWTFRRIHNLTAWAGAVRHRYNLPINLPNAPSNRGVPSLPTTSGPTPSAHASSRRSSNEALPPMIRPLPIGPSSVAPPSSWKKDVERIDFDPNVVAKKADGWDGMLATVLLRWVEEAVKERRAEVQEPHSVGLPSVDP